MVAYKICALGRELVHRYVIADCNVIYLIWHLTWQAQRTSTKTKHLADTGFNRRVRKLDMLDVAVIGAGPAGLSVAAALLQCKSKPSVKVRLILHGTNE